MKKNKTLIGGKYLGSGSYGCVVSPHLPCTKYKKHTKLNKNTKYVSKILKYQDEDSVHELYISDKLKKIDPYKKYFITYDSACNIKKVPTNRNNTLKVKFKNHNLLYYNEINNNGNIKYSGYNNSNSNSNNNNNKKKCLIDISLNPINIIMPYGGNDLIELKYIFYNYYNYYLPKYKKSKSKTNYNILKNNKYINSLKSYTLLNTNFKYYFKNLIIGLYKLHKNRIVNLDIKQENIMVNLKQNKIELRYIDFGFSEHLTEKYCKNYNNITLFGTTNFLPPEIFICNIINKYNKINSENKIFNEIYNYINNNVNKIYTEIKEYEYINILFNDYINKKNNKKSKPLLFTLYSEINKYFQNKTILNHYFGLNNVNSLDGFLQKCDVYSLGIAIYNYFMYDIIVMDIKKPEHIKLYKLIKKMIHPDHKQRYNILECLKDPYFN